TVRALRLNPTVDLIRSVAATGRETSDGVRMRQFRPMRMAVLGVLFALTAGFVTYLAMEVPVRNLANPPVITGGHARTYWPVAFTGLMGMVALGAMVVELALRRRDAATGGTSLASSHPPIGARLRIPKP